MIDMPEPERKSLTLLHAKIERALKRACTHPLLDYNFRPMVYCAKCGELLTGCDPYNHVGRLA